MERGSNRGSDTSPDAHAGGLHGHRWKIIERLLAALAALIAVAGGVVWLATKIREDSPVEKEQKLVQRLVAGQSFNRAVQIMDEQPHYTVRLASGNTMHQYDREWERIQLLVDPANRVLSVGIFAEEPEFRPSFQLGAIKPVLNRDPYSMLSSDPVYAFGGCAGTSSEYFEWQTLPNAAGGGSVAVGAHDSGRGSLRMTEVCNGLRAVPRSCIADSFEEARARSAADHSCLTSSHAGDFRHTTAFSAVILSRESMTSDMFQPPHIVAQGNQGPQHP